MNWFQRVLTSFLHGPIYIILFGFVFFAIGAGLTYHQFSLQREGAQAQGEVIGLSDICDDEGCTYAPVVRFQVPGGSTVTFESNNSSSPPAYDIGEKVTVLYPTDKPGKAIIKGEGLAFRIIFMSIGGIIMLAGLVFFLKLVKEDFSSG